MHKVYLSFNTQRKPWSILKSNMIRKLPEDLFNDFQKKKKNEESIFTVFS